MRAITIGFALALLPGLAMSQQQGAHPAPDKTFTSAPEIAALIAKAKRDRKPDQPMLSEHISGLYTANIEYRVGVAPAVIHEHITEAYYVIDGAGTIITGGKLVNETRRDAEAFSGTAIEGGRSQVLTKGDFIIVPENIPHWFSAINGSLVLLTLHLPPAPAKP